MAAISEGYCASSDLATKSGSSARESVCLSTRMEVTNKHVVFKLSVRQLVGVGRTTTWTLIGRSHA